MNTQANTYTINIDERGCTSTTQSANSNKRQSNERQSNKRAKENGRQWLPSKSTQWVNSMVVSLMNGKVPICLDPQDMNIAVKREQYTMRTIDDVVPSQIPNAKALSVLEAKSSFLQLKLADMAIQVDGTTFWY